MKKLQSSVLLFLAAMLGLFSACSAMAQTTLSATSLSFGKVAVGVQGPSYSVTFTNTSGSPIAISSIALTGVDTSSFVFANNCGASLAAGANCSIHGHMTPAVPGPLSAAVTITDSAGNSPQTIALSGTGLVSAPTLSATSLSFGSQVLGTTSTSQSVTLTNTATMPLAITSIAISGAGSSSFSVSNTCGTTVAAAGTCTIQGTFTPASLGALSATITFTDDATNSPQTIALSGTGVVAAPTLSASSLSFGAYAVGVSSYSQMVTLTNTSAEPLTISSIALTGANASSFVFANTCGTSVAAGANCTIHGHFTPAAQGQLTASIAITDNAAGSPQTIALSGTGLVSAPTLSATTLPFGSQVLNTTSAPRSVTLTNNGTGPLAITSIALSGAGASSFAISNTCGTSVPVAGNCTIQGTFKPLTLGALTATVTITDDATNSPRTIALSGTGVVAAPTLSANSLSFGAYAVGVSSYSQMVTLTNTSAEPLTISSIALTGTNASSFVFANTCGTSVAAGANCTIHGHFTPAAQGQLTASIAITDNAAGSPQTIALSGTGLVSAPTLSATTLPFGNQVLNITSASRSVTLTNNGTGPLAITSIALSGAGASSFAISNTCVTSVPVAGNCTIQGTFKPLTLGALAATITITDDATGSPQTIALSGTGLDPAPALSTTSVTFGSFAVGSQSASTYIALVNNGTAPLAISSIAVTGANASSFVFANTCGTSVAAGANCSIHGHFAPAAQGPLTAAITISDNAIGSPQAIALSGTGLVPVPTPVIASTGGTSATYPSTLTVTISDTDSTATIYYTTDGSTPSATHGSQYSGAITVSSTQTIMAVAIDASHNFTPSGTASKLFAITEATPMIAPAAGAVPAGSQITITDADSGAAIYYTTNGSPASTSSTRYAGALTLSAAETINAVAVDATASYGASQDASAAYTILVAASPAPTISSASGTTATYPSTFSVTLADTDTNVTIYYTTDGSTPSAANGTRYTSGTPFTVSQTETVSAIAINSSNSSTVATQLFTVQEAGPRFSPLAGYIPTAGASITITDADPNASIYYTTNGNPATGSSTPYTSPIPITAATTINAVAIDTTAGSNYTLSADASAPYALCPAGSICGSVVSGNLPVNGATVQLYAAGKTGYGAGAQALSTTPATITTSSVGAFSLKAPTCPTAPGDQLYLLATGGSTSGGSSESGIALMVALGTCSKLASVTTVTINEVTTIASAYALSGFATPNGSGAGIVVGAPAPSASCTLAQIGNSTCNYNGLVNAFRTVNNLVNISSGTPLTVTEFYDGSDPNNPTGWSSSYGDTQAPYSNCAASPTAANCLSFNNPVPSDDPRTGLPFSAASYQGLNTSLVPFQRLNTLGNVLASCVEQPGNCAGLSTLTDGSADTLQAALYIAQNPGKWSGTAGLYGQIAQPATAFTPPYGDGTVQTTLTAEPNDWTLAISFTGGGLGINPVIDATDTLLNQTLAIDLAGNVWVTAVPANPTALLSSGSSGTMAGFDPIGEALTPATSLVSGSVAVDTTNTLPYSTFGGEGPDYSYSGSLGVFGQPGWLAIDTSSPQFIWVGNNTGENDSFDQGPVQLKESSAVAPGSASNLQPAIIGPACTNASYNALSGGDMAIDGKYIWQLNYDGTLSFNDSNGNCVSAISLGLGYFSGNIGLAFDSHGNVWIGDGGSTQVVETSTSNTTGAPNGTYSNVYNAPTAIDTFAAGGNGNMVACNANQNGYVILNASNTNAPVSTFTTSNGRCGAFLTVDGAGKIWSYGGSAPANPQQALDEVAPAGTQISPNTGFTATSTAEQTSTGMTTIDADTNSGSAGGGIAVDPSGNLWFLNGRAGGQTSASLLTNALVEFIGVAAPTVTPTALATQNGAQATKP